MILHLEHSTMWAVAGSVGTVAGAVLAATSNLFKSVESSINLFGKPKENTKAPESASNVFTPPPLGTQSSSRSGGVATTTLAMLSGVLLEHDLVDSGTFVEVADSMDTLVSDLIPDLPEAVINVHDGFDIAGHIADAFDVFAG